MTAARPRVVIVGGGFAGLQAAKRLAKTSVDVVVVDRRNHHLFQPLLYQVATAALSPAQVATPIREILSRQANATVRLAEVRGIDVNARALMTTHGAIPYDYLVLAAGATHSYFGHDQWKDAAPGLKSIEDAVEIRRRFLFAYEQAEQEDDGAKQKAMLTFVIVGGGPTGVEMAGAIAEIARTVIRQDFRRIDTSQTRVVLVEGESTVLHSGFPPSLAERAMKDLQRLGVEVLVKTRVTDVIAGTPTSPPAVMLGDQKIEAHNIIWAAGVRASILGSMLGVECDRAGRVKVANDLSVPGHPEVFVTGDQAAVNDAKGQPVPGVAPAAMQMGRHVARVISAAVAGEPREPFRYRDKGSLATIGRARAVAAVFGMNFHGLLAWLLWACVHIMYLIGFRNRIGVMFDWTWSYIFFRRGARIITEPEEPAKEAT